MVFACIYRYSNRCCMWPKTPSVTTLCDIHVAIMVDNALTANIEGLYVIEQIVCDLVRTAKLEL